MLEVSNLSKYFYQQAFRKPVTAVSKVSFTIQPGQSFGLVGPSGSGKSTVGRMIVRLIEPSRGRICFNGCDITHLSKRNFKPYRRKIQIIFQQPQLALDPKQTIYSALAEPLSVHEPTLNKPDIHSRILDLLDQTNLTEDILVRRVHEISGGQAQRVVIARALTLDPEFIIADEPTSMLDLSVQAQILALLKDLQQKRRIGFLFISHDPAVIRVFCSQAARMEKGRIIGVGKPRDLYDSSTRLTSPAGMKALIDR